MRSRPGSFIASYQVSTFQVPLGNNREVFCRNVRVLYQLPPYRARIASTTSAPVAKRGVTRTLAGVAEDGSGVATAGPREQAANSRAASVAAATRNG